MADGRTFWWSVGSLTWEARVTELASGALAPGDRWWSVRLSEATSISGLTYERCIAVGLWLLSSTAMLGLGTATTGRSPEPHALPSRPRFRASKKRCLAAGRANQAKLIEAECVGPPDADGDPGLTTPCRPQHPWLRPTEFKRRNADAVLWLIVAWGRRGGLPDDPCLPLAPRVRSATDRVQRANIGEVAGGAAAMAWVTG